MTAVETVTSAAAAAPASPAAPSAPPDGGFDAALVDALDGQPVDAADDAAGDPPARGDTITFGEMVAVLAERGDAFGPPPAPAPAAPDGDVAQAAGVTAPDGDRPAGVPSDAWAHPGVRAASEYLGTPYLWGGTDPNVGLDCSGFVQRAFADVGVSLPRVSADQSRAGEAVTGGLDAARPGDLVYWAGRGGASNHIGIYLGDGQMMHAPRRGEDVQVASVRQAPPDAIRRVG